MEHEKAFINNLELPDAIIREFYCNELEEGFIPFQILPNSPAVCGRLSLLTLDLYAVLDWLHSQEAPRPLVKEVCLVPVLLYVPNFSTEHLLFHFDGTIQSAELIRNFLKLFGKLISNSKVTIISPSFIPKSKLKEEQDLINLVSLATLETSFIKFNFLRIGDFWSYAVKHDCTLLVTTKHFQADLTKVLFHFYKGKIWSNRLSFYLSV
jgi:hypothetical protein